MLRFRYSLLVAFVATDTAGAGLRSSHDDSIARRHSLTALTRLYLALASASTISCVVSGRSPSSRAGAVGAAVRQ